MKTFSLLSTLAIVAVVLGTILTGSVPVWGVEHCPGDISGESKDLTIKPGQCIEIQGIRRGCSSSVAPTFALILSTPKVITTHPENGTLSDGGVGSRKSVRCDGDEVAVRIIIYTPNPGFVGEDYMEFFSNEAITITVGQSKSKDGTDSDSQDDDSKW